MKIVRTTLAAVATTVALVAPGSPAQAANPMPDDRIVSFTSAGVIWACQTPESSVYGPIFRVVVAYQRAVKAPYGPYDGSPMAITNVMRKRNQTESVRVAQQSTSPNQWGGAQHNLGLHVVAASAVLGDNVVVQFHDGMYPAGNKTLVPSSLKRC